MFSIAIKKIKNDWIVSLYTLILSTTLIFFTSVKGFGSLLLSVMCLTGGIIALFIKEKNKFFSLMNSTFFIWVFGTISILSFIFSNPSMEKIANIDLSLRYLIVPICYISLKKIKISPHHILLSAAIGACISAATALMHTSSSPNNSPPNGGLGHHIMFGNFTALLAVFCIILITHPKSKLDLIIAAFGLILGVTATLATNSRGALLSLICLFTLIGSLKFKYTIKRNYLILLVSILITGSIANLNKYQSFIERFSLVYTETQDYIKHNKTSTSVGARLEMWHQATEIWKKNPILGAGPKSFYTESEKYFDKNKIYDPNWHFKHAHNDILNILAANGILGLLAYFGLIFFPIYEHTKRLKINPDNLFALMGLATSTGYFLFGLTESMLDRTIGVMFYLVFTILFLSQTDPATYNPSSIPKDSSMT